MRNYLIGALAVSLLFSISGCGASKEASAPAVSSSETSAPNTAQKTLDLSTAGSLGGRVLFEGEAPAPKAMSVKGNPECAVLHAGGNVISEELLVNDGGLQNAFVYIKEGLEGYVFDAPKESVTVNNKGCVYLPHVTGAQVNQEVIFLNSDATLHNVHSYPKANKGFNLGLPLVGMKQTKKFLAPEVMIPLKCDVHPWMLGYIGVLAHPYFAVTDAQGNFAIKNLPAGEYSVEVWHEKLGVQSQKIKIEPQQNQNLEFKDQP